MNNLDYFPEVIGQERAKRKLNFLLDCYKKTSILPPLLFVAPRGTGKSMIADSMHRHLTVPESGVPKTYVKINCASLKSLTQLFESVFNVYCLPEQYYTIFFEEASQIPRNIQFALLDILNPNKENKNTYTHGSYSVEFDLRFGSFLFATTEPAKIFHALRDRLTDNEIDLENYNHEQLAKILVRNLDGLEVDQEVLMEIVKVIRSSARGSVVWANRIKNYLHTKGKTIFLMEDWVHLKRSFGVMPMGLLSNEMNVLRALSEAGNDGLTLTMLSAKCRMTMSALSKDIEHHLLKHDLIFFDENRRRKISNRGRQVLAEIHA